MKKLTLNQIKKYQKYLHDEEKSQTTIDKYTRDIQAFYNFLLPEKVIHKEALINYKKSLETQYQITSINSMLTAINGLLDFMHLPECKVKLYKVQRKIFCDQEKELTKDEYYRLLKVAEMQKNERLFLVIQTICSTGIRVSEHRFITVENLKKGKAIIHNKGKIREIFFQKELRMMLLDYCQRNCIHSGVVFMTRTGRPLDRSNIWSEMKKLCQIANVDNRKVFPHNLRHLFALTYYNIEKDVIGLADILGHSHVDTTRIYTMTSGKEYENVMEKMGLLTSRIV